MAGFDDPGIAMSYVKSLRKSGHRQVKLHASEYDMQFLGAASEALSGSRSRNTAVGFALPNDPGEFDGPEEADQCEGPDDCDAHHPCVKHAAQKEGV